MKLTRTPRGELGLADVASDMLRLGMAMGARNPQTHGFLLH
jgi:hypothetical protein